MKAHKERKVGNRSRVRFQTDTPRDSRVRTPRLTVRWEETSGISIVQKTPRFIDPHK